MKIDLSQSCGHCLVFQICWHTEYSTFTASSFRNWNSSIGFPSPPIALFVVMLPKAHLTSHPRISDSRWVITPSWLSGSWRSFLYSSVYSCHLFLISSASVRSRPFLFLYQAHLCMKCSLGISNFLEQISHLSHSIVFLYFFALITLSPKNSICFLVGIEPNDTTKTKSVRRKDLLLPASKENTRDLSQNNISLKSKIREVSAKSTFVFLKGLE